MKNKVVQIIAAVVVFLVVALGAFFIARYILRDEVTVSTTKALTKALKNDRIKKITLIKGKETTIEITAGNYEGKELYIYTPDVEINNYGSFSAIKILDFEKSTFNEYGKNNSFYITCPSSIINIGKNTTVKDMYYAVTRGVGELHTNSPIEDVYVYGETTLELSGNFYGRINVNVKSENAVIRDQDYLANVYNGSEGIAKVITETGIKTLRIGESFDNVYEASESH